MRTAPFCALLCAISLLCFSTAQADDNARSWQGYYVGLHLGRTDFNSSWFDIDEDWGAGSGDDGSWNGYEFPADSSGTTLGVQGGHNWQFDDIVLGIEASAAFTDTRHVFTGDGTPCNGGCVDVTNSMKGYSTIRGRAGWAADRFLPFLTAGVVFAGFEHSWIEENDESDSWRDFGDLDAGLSYGGGVEFQMSNRISLRGDLLFLDFDDVTSRNADGYRMTVDRSAWIGSVGVDLRF